MMHKVPPQIRYMKQPALGVNSVKFLRTGSETTNYEFYSVLSEFECVLNDIAMNENLDNVPLNIKLRTTDVQTVCDINLPTTVVPQFESENSKNKTTITFQYNEFDDIVTPIQSFVHRSLKSPVATPAECKHCQDIDVKQTELLVNVRLWREQLMSTMRGTNYTTS